MNCHGVRGFFVWGGYVIFINRVTRRADFSMAVRNYTPSSPSPHPLTPSPTLSAVQPSPLATRSFGSYPFTSSPFDSSQAFSVTQARSSPSPDFFDDFIYSQDMDDDFRRIDSDAAIIIEAENARAGRRSPVQHNGLHVSRLTLPRDRRTWVVFRGKIPGIYDYRYVPPFSSE